MITRDELIAIGHYNKPHGVAGELSATVDVDLEVLRGLSCLVSDIDGIFVPFFVNAIRPKSVDTMLLTIDGIENEKEAARLVNRDIWISSLALSCVTATAAGWERSPMWMSRPRTLSLSLTATVARSWCPPPMT